MNRLGAHTDPFDPCPQSNVYTCPFPFQRSDPTRPPPGYYVLVDALFTASDAPSPRVLQNSRRTWAAILGVRVRVKTPFIFSPPTRIMLCTAAKSAKFQTCIPATKSLPAATSK